MRVRYTYRLRVSTAAGRTLLEEWHRCRWVWNQCVAESKRAHLVKRECGAAQLDRMLTGWRRDRDWLKAGVSVPQQQVVRDFAKSRTKALMDVGNRVPLRRRAGMPRFKRRQVALPTMNFTKRGFRIKAGYLVLAGGVKVRPVWSRRLPSVPTSVRVYRDVLGHWYASFVVDIDGEPLPKAGRVIGVDWGVKDIATTTSDDCDLPHPQYGRTAAARLARYQRMMARRKPRKGMPASKNYRIARRAAAASYKKVVRQRHDTARKWAKRVVREHDAMAVEDFRPRFLARSTMARKAADAAIGVTKAELIHMARKHARLLILVNPANTTTDCARCGARTTHALPLSQRTFSCSECGHTAPRDKNSAHVMLVRAGLDPAGVDRIRPVQSLVEQAA